MSSSIYYVKIITRLNERLFTNALVGITEAQANERLSDHNNPVIWIAAHTVWARYNTLALLGKPVKNPYEGLFENFKAFDASLDYTSIEAIRTEWKKVSNLLNDAFESVQEPHLASEAPIKNPIGDFTIGGTIAFLAQHESYDIGQLALLKKYLTAEAMSYS